MFKKDSDQEQAKRAAAIEKQAAKQAEADRKAAEKAEAAFRATPRGQARTAREEGAGFFEYIGSLAETKRTTMGVLSGGATASHQKRRFKTHTDVLSQIEDEGWKLDQAGYVYEPTGTVSRDKMFSSGQTATMNGRIVGIYLFRLDEHWTPPIQAEAEEIEQAELVAIEAPTQNPQPAQRFDTHTGEPLN